MWCSNRKELERKDIELIQSIQKPPPHRQIGDFLHCHFKAPLQYNTNVDPINIQQLKRYPDAEKLYPFIEIIDYSYKHLPSDYELISEDRDEEFMYK